MCHRKMFPQEDQMKCQIISKLSKDKSDNSKAKIEQSENCDEDR